MYNSNDIGINIFNIVIDIFNRLIITINHADIPLDLLIIANMLDLAGSGRLLTKSSFVNPIPEDPEDDDIIGYVFIFYVLDTVVSLTPY